MTLPRKNHAGEGPRDGLAVIMGSGLGGVESRLRERLGGLFTVGAHVRFEDIEGVGACTVAGHGGAVCVGEIGPVPLALVRGRRHVYEGGRFGMAALVRWLSENGIGDVVTVSAAGSVRGAVYPGQLIIIKEIIDLQNRDYLQPRLREGGGGDCPDRAVARSRPVLSSRLARGLEAAAARAGVGLARGTVACVPGPAYESPAEIRALQALGADVVTMSAAPEVQLAAALGMEVAAVAAVTNPGTGIGLEPPNHGRVLEAAAAMSRSLGDVLAELVAGPAGGAKKRL